MHDAIREGGFAEERVVGADRVLAVLAALGGYPAGAGLDELARVVGSPKSSVHRALAALRRAGFADQDGRGHYVLGDRLLRLAFDHHEERPDHVRVMPVLEELAKAFGETAHYAVLDGRDVVYRSKADPTVGAVRLTSTVGGRNPAHSTAIGKLLLAYKFPDDAAVREWVASGVLSARTPRTHTSAEELVVELRRVRRDGYATDDQENEEGICCLAVPAFLTSSRHPSGAVSVSALAYRTPIASLIRAVPQIRALVANAMATVAVAT